jgi:hypothetical protein
VEAADVRAPLLCMSLLHQKEKEKKEKKRCGWKTVYCCASLFSWSLSLSERYFLVFLYSCAASPRRFAKLLSVEFAPVMSATPASL